MFGQNPGNIPEAAYSFHMVPKIEVLTNLPCLTYNINQWQEPCSKDAGEINSIKGSVSAKSFRVRIEIIVAK
jgi:hypothetical protein